MNKSVTCQAHKEMAVSQYRHISAQERQNKLEHYHENSSTSSSIIE